MYDKLKEEYSHIKGQKVLLSLSGGLDSTTLLYFLKSLDCDVTAISFDYGSKQNKMEQKYAKKNCKKLNVPHKIIKLDFFNKYFKSSLLKNSSEEIPTGKYDGENIKSTVVPFRNGIFLSILGGIAESENCNFIALASHSGDHAIYPDCRPEFTQEMHKAVELGTTNHVKFVAPFNLITKGNIVEIGKKLKIKYKNTYSCYRGEKIHCGNCTTCNERKEAFKEAGVKDPTIYQQQ